VPALHSRNVSVCENTVNELERQYFHAIKLFAAAPDNGAS